MRSRVIDEAKQLRIMKEERERRRALNDIKMLTCDDEEAALRKRLYDLDDELFDVRQRLSELQTTSGAFEPVERPAPRISVGVTCEEYTEIQDLAKRHSTSPSALGQLALRHLVIQARSGALPMIVPHDWSGKA